MRNLSPIRASRGASLVLVSLALLALLAVLSLTVDLGMLYVARSQAQQAADAAALAGASALADSNCLTGVSGCAAGGSQESQAMQQAETAGAQNYVMGMAASIQNSDITFSYPNSLEPEITVTVQRTVARGNAVPTLFAQVFGVGLANVAAKATAEAFNPSGSGVPVSYACVAPFLVPNCDPSHVNVPTGNLNNACNAGGGGAGYFINPSTGQIENPGLYSAGGAIGEPWQLHSQAAPSQWFLIAFAGSQSAANLRAYISQCAPQIVACGSTIVTFNGSSVGPTDQGTDARINASGDGLGQGQDTINTSVSPPFPITGGLNNPNPALVGNTYYGPSPSEVLVPVYDGHALNPGGDTVTVTGFMQIFIQDANHNGLDMLIDSVVLNVLPCSSGGGAGGGNGTTPSISAPGGMAIPIRLIRTQ